jgi:hypothetical protein
LLIGLPHSGQEVTLLEISFPHSEHLINAIVPRLDCILYRDNFYKGQEDHVHLNRIWII